VYHNASIFQAYALFARLCGEYNGSLFSDKKPCLFALRRVFIISPNRRQIKRMPHKSAFCTLIEAQRAVFLASRPGK
jgi:hypothetical protein